MCVKEGMQVTALGAPESEHTGSGWCRAHFLCGCPYSAMVQICDQTSVKMQQWNFSHFLHSACTVPRPAVLLTEPYARDKGRAGFGFLGQGRDSWNELTEVFTSGCLKYRLCNVILQQPFSESLFATVQINEHSIKIWSAGLTLNQHNCFFCPNTVAV